MWTTWTRRRQEKNMGCEAAGVGQESLPGFGSIKGGQGIVHANALQVPSLGLLAFGEKEPRRSLMEMEQLHSAPPGEILQSTGTVPADKGARPVQEDCARLGSDLQVQPRENNSKAMWRWGASSLCTCNRLQTKEVSREGLCTLPSRG